MSASRSASLWVFLLCLGVYNANLRAISAGDTYTARYLPFAILRDHTVFLNPVEKVAAQGRGEGAYWMLRRPDGPIVSLYPVTQPLLISPLYVPAVAYLRHEGWTDARLDHVARIMEKLSASFLAALSASLLFLLLRRRVEPGDAWLLTLAYAFGTTTWVVSSQALWQHGIAQVMITGALLLLTGPSTTFRAVLAGLLLGLIGANRPPDILIGAALGAYGLFWAGRRRAWFAAAGTLPMLLVLFYNLRAAGNLGGGYGVIGKARFFSHDALVGLAGLLISPTRGLLVFSPFLIFLVLAFRCPPRTREERGLTLAMAVAVGLQILVYAKIDWRGGLSWGPRYTTDLLPLLFWMLAPVVAALRGVGRAVFLGAVGVAVALEAIGAFAYSPPLDLPIYGADHGAEKHDLRAAFDWRNAPYLRALEHGLVPGDLAGQVRGTIDQVESDGRATLTVTAGEETFAAGWALVGNATPFQVAITIDGRGSGSSATFFDRPDVRAALHEKSPAGWRIPIDTSGLAPGEHRLTAMVWASPKGEGRYLDDRVLSVRPGEVPSPHIDATGANLPDDLRAGARAAIARLRAHQQPEGYWLTSHTKAPRFADPHPEMNTYLTALLVDLMDPIAAASGLADAVDRARLHLRDQIETDGLVRYHGRPDGPGIGTLGCVITPDTDDTALAWRVAPASDRARLDAALATLERYRTRDGLYRSWLAPREAYQCLDPGRDPNPTDVAIQMHLLQLLVEVRPQAGRALCDALRRTVNEDRVWVYYAQAPLVPILRAPELRKAGCDLTLPEARLRTEAPSQAIWVSVLRIAAGAPAPGGPAPDPTVVRAILRELLRDDFALVRTAPPLLYHNDLTATVPRYYWSEDVGYALWLRLLGEYERLGRPPLG